MMKHRGSDDSKYFKINITTIRRLEREMLRFDTAVSSQNYEFNVFFV